MLKEKSQKNIKNTKSDKNKTHNLQILKDYVKGVVSQLSPREQKILEMRFGLTDGVAHTLEEVGREFEVTRERIRQIESEALEKIRKIKGLEVFNNLKSKLDNKSKKINEDSKLKRCLNEVDPVIGVKDLSRQISKLIVDMVGEDGSMFGIFGRWGRGKTYLIDKIKKEKEIEKEFNIIDFNAWKYQETPALWAHLYLELNNSYYSKKNIIKKVKGYFFEYKIIILICILFLILYWIFSDKLIINNLSKNLIIIPTLSLPIIITFLQYLYKSTILVKKISNEIRGEDVKKYLGSQYKIQRKIVKFIKKVSNLNKKKFLLFVDNLDRCSYKNIINVLESLRVILDDNIIKDQFVIVVAIDKKILVSSIKNKYNDLKLDEEASKKIIKEHLDKLFLAGIYLGDLTKNEKSDILWNYCNNFKVKKKLTLKYNIENNIETSSNKIDYENMDQIRKSEMTDTEIKKMDNKISGINFTPREISIFLFRYLLIRYLLNSKGINWQEIDINSLIIDYTENQRLSSGNDEIDKIIETVVCY